MLMKNLLFLLLFIIGENLYAQQHSEYLYKEYKKEGKVLNYRILYPHDFDKSKSYPLVLFLHGMGERGNDNETQLALGADFFNEGIKKHPAIVIFPQCPVTDYWANLYRPDEGGAKRIYTFHIDQGPHPTLALVMALLDEMIAEPFIDDDRIYLGGLSMGAFGVWELLWRMPEKIAAAFPICGGGPREKAPAMISVPTWVFHGAKDDVVNPRYSIIMTEAIQQAGGQSKITLIPEGNHNAWDNAFADPELLNWLFSKKRNKNYE